VTGFKEDDRLKTLKKVFLVLSLAGLTACAGVQGPLPDSDSPEQREIMGIDLFLLSGNRNK
jgi:aconitase A